MSSYLCRWPNGDISLVSGNNRLTIDEVLQLESQGPLRTGPKKGMSMTLRKRTKDTEDGHHRTRQQDPRSTEQPKSREEVIHEVIDEWLAPTLIRLAVLLSGVLTIRK